MIGSPKKVIAIDGMGGDNAPSSVFGGLSNATKNGVHYIVFGDSSLLSRYESTLPSDLSYEIRHVEETVTSDMDVMSSLRSGKKSGMGLAIQSVKDGEAQAVVSSGNTGLYMALAKIILGTVTGIDRPAIASIMPGKVGNSVFLDLGANADCNEKNLVDFAILGEAVARSYFNKKNIKIALLNIGTENAKGSKLVKHVSEILKQTFPGYVGFVEGNDICKGEVDVIVTDGFTGNVALKTMEGMAKFITGELKESLSSSFLSKIGALFSLPSLNKLKKKMDPRLYNGAILVGLNGVVVKSHGNSDSIGFANAVNFTANLLNENMFDRIKEQISNVENTTSRDITE